MDFIADAQKPKIIRGGFYMDERRKEIRLDKFLSISYRISKGLLKSSARSRNVSQGGICLPVFQWLDPGLMLDMEIKVQEYEKPILASGEVIWIKANPGNKQYPFEAGIRILKIASLGKNEIKKILEKASS
jgi:c-di-GMP-binding flagellar brake protein YcgR